MILVTALLPVALGAREAEAVLQNIGGTVRYESGGAAAQDLGKGESIALREGDVATTGNNNSLAQLVLADASVFTMAQNTRIQLATMRLNHADDSATFFLVGKVRFDVKKSNGITPHFTFMTAITKISVGTGVGDISTLNDGVVVSSYAGCETAINTIAGGQMKVSPGDSLRVSVQNGKVVASHDPTFNHLLAPFGEGGKECTGSK